MNTNHKDQQWVFAKDVAGETAAPGLTRKVMAYCNAMMCVANEFETGATASMHSHPHTQIAYIAEGRFRFTIGDDVREISKGDTICVQNNVQHSCECLEKGIVIDFFTPMREDFVS